jgi:hypothetical protein
VLSWAIAATLRRVHEPPMHDPGVGPAPLACAAGERRTLALDALRAELAGHGHASRMLGASVPRSTLAAVVVHPTHGGGALGAP